MRNDLILNSDFMEEEPIHECKNCSTAIEGPFCHFCGQRYHDHKESFGELVYEFISDFLHFDSRFFKTILPLIFLPGKLTRSYNEGRQRSQFHPIRLYLFSSFVYFFLFFYFNNPTQTFNTANNANPAAFIIDSVNSSIRKDSLNQAQKASADSSFRNRSIAGKPGTRPVAEKKAISVAKYPIARNSTTSITLTSNLDSLLLKKVSPEEYTRQQKALSNDRKAGFFERLITMRLLKINLEGTGGKEEFVKKVTETFFHNIPKMLFFLLPVFALFLKILYIRRKQFYYVDHAILSLHYFSFIFLLLVISHFILDKIFGTEFFTRVAGIWIMLYLPLAMKKLYAQSWSKTIVKFIVLSFLFIFSVFIGLIVNMAWAAFMI